MNERDSEHFDRADQFRWAYYARRTGAAPVGGVMTQSCKTCRWFDPSFAPDEDEHEALGLCEWPADRLPYSLRWGNRERVAVRPLEGSDCPCYEPAP